MLGSHFNSRASERQEKMRFCDKHTNNRPAFKSRKVMTIFQTLLLFGSGFLKRFIEVDLYEVICGDIHQQVMETK